MAVFNFIKSDVETSIDEYIKITFNIQQHIILDRLYMKQ